MLLQFSSFFYQLQNCIIIKIGSFIKKENINQNKSKVNQKAFVTYKKKKDVI